MAKSDNKAMQPIGILGGTFDPVHFGHLRPALEVVEQFKLDRLHLIPCANPPHREQPQATAQQRLAMLKRAVTGIKQFVVDDRELQRQGESYTVDTLHSLRSEYPNNPLFLLIGSDAFKGLESWSRWQQILTLAHIVVMQRPQEALNLSDAMQGWYQQHLGQSLQQQQLAAGHIWPVQVSQLAISATQIRQSLAQGNSPRFLLPDAVLDFIQQNELYQAHG